MDFLEKDLEDILIGSDQENIQVRGLKFFEYHFIQRQFILGNYGKVDIMTLYFIPNRPFIITIYELKNKIINSAAWWQLVRYIRGVKHFLEELGLNESRCGVQGVLIGRSVELNGEIGYIPFLESNISIYTYEYKLNGLFFQRYIGAHLISPGTINLESINGFSAEKPRDLLRFLAFAKQHFSEYPTNEKSP